jgi:intracellular multiplication protein IcmC
MFKQKHRFVLLASFLLLSGCTTTGKGADVAQMIQNFSATFPALWGLVTGAAYIIGMIFALRALYYLKIYGQSQTMMAGHSNLKTPLILFLCSAALIFAPTAFQTITQTFFATTNPLAWEPPAGGMGTTTAILNFVALVGVISFVRGWVQLSHLAQQGGSHPNAFGKAMTHIIGGVLAINIKAVVSVMQNTFGF